MRDTYTAEKFKQTLLPVDSNYWVYKYDEREKEDVDLREERRIQSIFGTKN